MQKEKPALAATGWPQPPLRLTVSPACQGHQPFWLKPTGVWSLSFVTKTIKRPYQPLRTQGLHSRPHTIRPGAPRDFTSPGQFHGCLLSDPRVGASHNDCLPGNGGLAGTGPARNVVSVGKKRGGHFGPCVHCDYYDLGRLCSRSDRTGRTSPNSVGARVVVQAKAPHGWVLGRLRMGTSLLCKDPMDWFPMAAVTSDHRLSQLKPCTGKSMGLQAGAQDGSHREKDRCWQGCAPPGGSRERWVTCLFQLRGMPTLPGSRPLHLSTASSGPDSEGPL